MDERQVKGLAGEAAGKIESGVGGLTGDRDLQAKGTARDYAGQADQILGRAKDAASDMLDGIAERGSDTYAQGAAYARESADTMQTMVKDYPVGSLAMAAGLGYLFALVIHGRR